MDIGELMQMEHEKWLERVKPLMGVTPIMTTPRWKWTDMGIPTEWHGNYPLHIDYEALRRNL